MIWYLILLILILFEVVLFRLVLDVKRNLETKAIRNSYLAYCILTSIYIIFYNIYVIGFLDNFFVLPIVLSCFYLILIVLTAYLIITKKYQDYIGVRVSDYEALRFAIIMLVIIVTLVSIFFNMESIEKETIVEYEEKIQLQELEDGSNYYGMLNQLAGNMYTFVYREKESGEVESKFGVLVLDSEDTRFHINESSPQSITIIKKKKVYENIWGREVRKRECFTYEIYIQNESQISNFNKFEIK